MKKIKIKSAMEWGKKFEALKKVIPTCVQCGWDINLIFPTADKVFQVCSTPGCPNYALLSLSPETMCILSKKGINSLPVSKKKSKKE